MQKNEYSISINCSKADLFTYLQDPRKTPLWISNLLKEETNEWPLRVGSLCRMSFKDDEIDGKINQIEFQIKKIEENKLIEFSQSNLFRNLSFNLENADKGIYLTIKETSDDHILPIVSESDLKAIKDLLEGKRSEVNEDQPPIMIELTRYKIKKDKSSKVDEWLSFIRENSKTEIDEKVRENEKMLIETIFRQKEGEMEYLYWFHIQGKSPSNLTSSEYLVDKKHLEYAKECIEEGSRTDMNLEVAMILSRLRVLLV